MAVRFATAICQRSPVHVALYISAAYTTGRLAKTDALDAQVLAQFAEAVRPPLRPLRDADTQELNESTTRRNQLMTMLVAEKNRLGRGTGAVHPRIKAHSTWLEQELKDLDGDLRESVCSSPVWWGKDQLLRSVPGVGEQVSVTLLAELPELGTLDRKQIAARSGWLSSAGTAVPTAGSAPFGAAGPEYAPRCTWGRWLRAAGTRWSGTFTRGCWQPAN